MIAAIMSLQSASELSDVLFDVMSDGVMIVDQQGIILDCNPAFHQKLGYDKSEVVGMSVKALDPPEFAARVPERLAQIHSQGQATFETAHYRKDGSVMPVELNARFFESNGETVFFSIVRDISKRRQAEAKLRENVERFEAFIKYLPAKIHIKDTDGRYILINPHSEQLFGISNAQAVGKTASEVFSEHIGETFDEHDQEVLRTGAAVAKEENFQIAGENHTYLTVKFPIRDAEGTITSVGASGFDITDQKHAEHALKKARDELELRVHERTEQLQYEVEGRKRVAQQLRASEERFRDIAESSSDWFWEMGPTLKFTSITGAFRKIVGQDPKLFIGQSRRALMGEDESSEKWQEHLSDLENHRPFRDFEYEILRPDGSSRFISVSGKPLFDDAGEFQGYRGAGTNITAHKISERKLIETANELQGILATTMPERLKSIRVWPTCWACHKAKRSAHPSTII